jgi:ABC-type multidrug transport system fused ATPase/permease subunit
MESIVYKKIQVHRKLFLSHLRSILKWLALPQGYTFAVPTTVSVATFSFYSLTGTVMDPTIVFPAIALFAGLITPLTQATMAVQAFSKFFVSWKRLEEFLINEELERLTGDEVKVSTDYSILFKDVTTKTTFPLQVNLELPKEGLVALIGTIGAGKSLCCKTILGQVPMEGVVSVNGKIAFCDQSTWIMNGTIKDNIVFTHDFDQDKLSSVLHETGLDDDLKSFSDGVDTILSHNGSSLSGGQAARVALARALYSDADIIVLDDILAALDGTVQSAVFESLKRYSTSKLVLLVTHQLEFLSSTNRVIWLEEGKVKAYGTTSHVMGRYPDLQKYITEEDDKKQKESRKEELIHSSQVDEIEEERNNGRVPFSVYKAYVDKGGGLWFPMFMIVFLGVFVGLQVKASLYLTEATVVELDDFIVNFTLYSFSSVLALLVYFVFAVILSYRAANQLHDEALQHVLHVVYEWFESQPVGRMINRFSSDVNALDVKFLSIFLYISITFGGILVSVILVLQSDWYLGILFALIMFTLYRVFIYYQAANMDLKRLVSVMYSPVDGHVTDTINGKSTIEAFGFQRKFTTKFYRIVDDAACSFYIREYLNSWIQLRIGLLISTITMAIVLISEFGKTQKVNVVEGSSAGLALTSSLSLAQQVFILLHALGVGESEFNAAERLEHYSELEMEPKRPIDQNWTATGDIEFDGVVFRYPSKPDIDILKSISFNIAAGEKIGVVGRTGSGKSTLITVLFQLFPLHKGTIRINGQDISLLDLPMLRSNISIIPQKATFFKGTIRENVDPFGHATDEKIWDAFRLVGLKEIVEKEASKLDTELNATSLSAGQQQLFQLARVWLENPKILILDESNSFVDKETDQMMMKLILEEFKNTTVLSIIHRLDQVSLYDRVMVMDHGNMIEFDHYDNLKAIKAM